MGDHQRRGRLHQGPHQCRNRRRPGGFDRRRPHDLQCTGRWCGSQHAVTDLLHQLRSDQPRSGGCRDQFREDRPLPGWLTANLQDRERGWPYLGQPRYHFSDNRVGRDVDLGPGGEIFDTYGAGLDIPVACY
ncbi:hypothetical protein MHPYR_310039 [uncultured Mycobacterium sp.]|uniref:Uncharacterized protein n=1 Tax=uncultured Mycobacterium sp. TaxID=171292 RepID=A0A1Y5PCE9_9MYCO|nr:hypothetical protein MHPYR_310039 [uncultured Mycobacterium sp.]